MMSKLNLYYATNRRHSGNNRWNPDCYGDDFSSDGTENLRFGKLTLEADENEIRKCLKEETKMGKGDGEGLAEYLSGLANENGAMKISAFEENITKTKSSEQNPPNATRYGSLTMFEEIQKIMKKSHDVLIFIHGFNVAWNDAVGSALALQEMLNSDDANKSTLVVLFSWPSDGRLLFSSDGRSLSAYISDRKDAYESGCAVGRGILKLRDFLCRLRHNGVERCNGEFHLLCHSMGNYVLQSTVEKIAQFSNGSVLPCIFDHIFMCAPDVDDNVLGPDGALACLHKITRNVTVYFNTEDSAFKLQGDRLGATGFDCPSRVHSKTKIHQVDCSPIVKGWVEHSYYLNGQVNKDIRDSIAGEHQSGRSYRKSHSGTCNTWIMDKTSLPKKTRSRRRRQERPAP